MTTTIEAGSWPTELNNGHTINIDQPLTRDEHVRIGRALTEIGDPGGTTVDRIDLHPIEGEIAFTTVHTRPCLRPDAHCTCQQTECPIMEVRVRA